MKISVLRCALLAAVALIAATASAQNLAANQTLGFGANQLLRFTYTQNFDCIDQPFDDLNFNGVVAAKDPASCKRRSARQESTFYQSSGTSRQSYQYDRTPVRAGSAFLMNNDQNPNDAISCNNVWPARCAGPLSVPN